MTAFTNSKAELTSLPLAISMGDPCGIGPEIVAALWLADIPPHAVVVGSRDVMARALAVWALKDASAGRVTIQMVDFAKAQTVPTHVMQVCEPANLPTGLATLPWGQVSAAAGQAAAVCVRKGVHAIQQGLARALVTAPLHKKALALAGESFPGHTELLQALATPPGQSLRPVRMMLASHDLRVVLVSIHVPLRAALVAVTFNNVLQTIRIAHQSLQRMGIPHPRIGVAGLNPHAGEGGLFGEEEVNVIAPAVQQARLEGVDASGPWAPDTVFMRARRGTEKPGQFDVVVAMYHDQGLIPVKYMGVAHGVNVTLGLPFVRTSPDHGTAFDLAGLGQADPTSMQTACCMALSLTTGQ